MFLSTFANQMLDFIDLKCRLCLLKIMDPINLGNLPTCVLGIGWVGGGREVEGGIIDTICYRGDFPF